MLALYVLVAVTGAVAGRSSPLITDWKLICKLGVVGAPVVLQRKVQTAAKIWKDFGGCAKRGDCWAGNDFPMAAPPLELFLEEPGAH